MIVDTSALIAILVNEPERAAFVNALVEAEARKVSAGSAIEATVVMTRKLGVDEADLDRLLRQLRIVVEPVTAAQAEIGREAYRRYGQVSGSRARLNFGDCFAYALARDTGEPLLFKGDDFVHTDVARAG